MNDAVNLHWLVKESVMLIGGSGVDTALYTGSSSGVTVRLFNSTGQNGDAEGDTLSSIEVVSGISHRDVFIGAFNSNDIFYGQAGNDYLDGLSGDDTLYGGTNTITPLDMLLADIDVSDFVF